MKDGSPETVSVVEEEVFRLGFSEVELGALSSQDDLIPQNHLVQSLGRRGGRG